MIESCMYAAMSNELEVRRAATWYEFKTIEKLELKAARLPILADRADRRTGCASLGAHHFVI